jgi:hypothetical protein
MQFWQKQHFGTSTKSRCHYDFAKPTTNQSYISSPPITNWVYATLHEVISWSITNWVFIRVLISCSFIQVDLLNQFFCPLFFLSSLAMVTIQYFEIFSFPFVVGQC